MPKRRRPGQRRRQPNWMARALDPSTPTLNNQTVRTASTEYQGKEILYPTIRMGADGKLKKLSEADAYWSALKNRDYFTFNTPDEATAFSKRLSNLIRRSRGM